MLPSRPIFSHPSGRGSEDRVSSAWSSVVHIGADTVVDDEVIKNVIIASGRIEIYEPDKSAEHDT